MTQENNNIFNENTKLYISKIRQSIDINFFDKSIYFMAEWIKNKEKYKNVKLLAPNDIWELVIGGYSKYLFFDKKMIRIINQEESGFFSYDDLTNNKRLYNKMKMTAYESAEIDNDDFYKNEIIQSYNELKKRLVFMLFQGPRYFISPNMIEKNITEFLGDSEKKLFVIPMVLCKTHCIFSLVIINKNTKSVELYYKNIKGQLNISISGEIMKVRNYFEKIKQLGKYKFFCRTSRNMISQIKFKNDLFFIYLILELRQKNINIAFNEFIENINTIKHNELKKQINQLITKLKKEAGRYTANIYTNIIDKFPEYLNKYNDENLLEIPEGYEIKKNKELFRRMTGNNHRVNIFDTNGNDINNELFI